MGSVDPSYVLALGGVLLAWLGLSACVVVGRLQHERRSRRVASDTGAGSPRSSLAEPSWRALATGAEAEPRRFEVFRLLAALHALARDRDAPTAAGLNRALRTLDPEAGAAAAAILGEIEKSWSAQALVESLKAGHCSPTWIALQLDRLSFPLDDLLEPLLQDPEPTVRAWAARLLSGRGSLDGLAGALVQLSRDPHPDVRAAAVRALGSAKGRATLEALRARISDPVWYVRAQAARALGRRGRVRDAPLLASLLSDETWWVRTAAKEGLQMLGPAAAEHLFPCLDQEDRFAQNGAAEVLQNLGIVDALVEEVGTGSAPVASGVLLRKIFAAGGLRLASAALARAEPTARGELQPIAESLFGRAAEAA